MYSIHQPKGFQCKTQTYNITIYDNRSSCCTITNEICNIASTCGSLHSTDNGTFIVQTGHCPISYTFTSFIKTRNICFIPAEIGLVNVTKDNCRTRTGRQGVLCGECAQGYDIAVNSYDLFCGNNNCTGSYFCCDKNGILFLLFLEILPTIIMMVVLSILHIKIPSGLLNSYVFYCQMLTLQIPGVSLLKKSLLNIIQNSLYNTELKGIPSLLLSFWNLQFFHALYSWYPVCIPGLQTVDVLALRYMVAVIPLVFIAVSYFWMELYGNGYRCVFHTTKPVHQVLAHFWRKFNMQPSLVDTYAGLILLSFMSLRPHLSTFFTQQLFIL